MGRDGEVLVCCRWGQSEVDVCFSFRLDHTGVSFACTRRAYLRRCLSLRQRLA